MKKIIFFRLYSAILQWLSLYESSVEFRLNIIMIVKSIMTRLAPIKKSARTTSSTGNSVDLSKFNEQQKQILNRIENLANFDCEFSLSDSVNVKFKNLDQAKKDEI